MKASPSLALFVLMTFVANSLAFIMRKSFSSRICPHRLSTTYFCFSDKRQYSRSAMSMGLSVKIVGGGLAGLATSYHLVESGKCERITICDTRSSPGQGGASSVAAGLMHPFTPQGKLIWAGLTGLEESVKLLKFAEPFSSSGRQLLSTPSARILRPCFTDKSLADWRKAASERSSWISEVSVEEYASNVGQSLREGDVPLGVFSINNIHVIDSPSYLQALWAGMLARYGDSCVMEWEQGHVESIEQEVQGGRYDTVVVASGAGVQLLWGGAGPLPFTYVRGQNLYYEHEEAQCASNFTGTLSGEYVCRTGKVFVCGATHEYGELDALLAMPPSKEHASEALTPKVNRLYPRLRGKEPIDCKAGIRVASPRTHLGRLPVIAQHPLHGRKAWLISGFGSRGLIHHAVFGKMLARAITDQEELPAELGL